VKSTMVATRFYVEVFITLATFGLCMGLIVKNPFWDLADIIGSAGVLTIITLIWLVRTVMEAMRSSEYNIKGTSNLI